MASQIEVKRMSYRLSSNESLDELPEEEREETKKALYEYVFWRAQGDQYLSRDETESFREAHIRCNDGCNEGVSSAQLVGRRLAELGDQIDSMYGDQFDDIMEIYEKPEQAFSSFMAVVRNVFEWDEYGLPKLNVGRIAAVLGFCYHLCKKYINQYMNSYGLVTFLGSLAGLLVRFFIQAKFYDWLNRNGGWSQLLQTSAVGILNKFGVTNWGPSMFFVIGITCLAISAFQYFRNR